MGERLGNYIIEMNAISLEKEANNCYCNAKGF